jgi:hypothetical protein
MKLSANCAARDIVGEKQPSGVTTYTQMGQTMAPSACDTE